MKTVNFIWERETEREREKDQACFRTKRWSIWERSHVLPYIYKKLQSVGTWIETHIPILTQLQADQTKIVQITVKLFKEKTSSKIDTPQQQNSQQIGITSLIDPSYQLTQIKPHIINCTDLNRQTEKDQEKIEEVEFFLFS